MCLYWLCKEEVAHCSKFGKLLDLVDLLDKDVLLDLKKGANASYRSHRSISEFLSLITSKQLIVYSRYLCCQKDENNIPLSGIAVWIRYLGMAEIGHADAPGIVIALLSLLETKYGIVEGDLQQKLAGFGSNGANVMTGRHTGVSTRLKQIVPGLISLHCAAHKLALAASETASEISAANHFRSLVNGLFHYLHQSPARSSRFLEVQQAFHLPELKLKEAKDVRWLSCSQALKRNLFPLTIFMNNEAEMGDATALGLSVALQSYSFIAGVYFTAEVLPHLAHLSLCFQEEKLLWHEVPILLEAVLKVLNDMLVNASSPESEWQKNIEAYLKKAEEEGICISYSARNQRMRSQESHKENFVTSFCKPYLETLMRNLKARFPPEDIQFLSSYQLFDATITLSSDKLHTLLNIAAKHLASTAVEHESDVFSAIRSEYLTFSSTIRQKGFENTSNVMKDVAAKLLPGHTTVFPLLANLASRLLVIPASTADCERIFCTKANKNFNS